MIKLFQIKKENSFFDLWPDSNPGHTSYYADTESSRVVDCYELNMVLEFYKKNEVEPSYSLTVNVNGLSRAEFTNLIYDIAGDFCKISHCEAWSVRARKDVITELKK